MKIQPTKQQVAALDAQRAAIYKEQDERMKTDQEESRAHTPDDMEIKESGVSE